MPVEPPHRQEFRCQAFCKSMVADHTSKATSALCESWTRWTGCTCRRLESSDRLAQSLAALASAGGSIICLLHLVHGFQCGSVASICARISIRQSERFRRSWSPSASVTRLCGRGRWGVPHRSSANDSGGFMRMSKRQRARCQTGHVMSFARHEMSSDSKRAASDAFRPRLPHSSAPNLQGPKGRHSQSTGVATLGVC